MVSVDFLEVLLAEVVAWHQVLWYRHASFLNLHRVLEVVVRQVEALENRFRCLLKLV